MTENVYPLPRLSYSLSRITLRAAELPTTEPSCHIAAADDQTLIVECKNSLESAYQGYIWQQLGHLTKVIKNDNIWWIWGIEHHWTGQEGFFYKYTLIIAISLSDSTLEDNWLGNGRAINNNPNTLMWM